MLCVNVYLLYVKYRYFWDVGSSFQFLFRHTGTVYSLVSVLVLNNLPYQK